MKMINGGNASIMRSSCFSMILPMIMVLMMTLFGATHAQMDLALSHTSIIRSNHGSSIDQGIAYVLLFLALAVTYILH